jgi:uncharacterized protein (TIGR02145 family)
MKMKKLVLRVFVLLSIAIIYTACNDDNEEDEPTDPNKGTVTDSQGNSYPTVKIGEQWWMAENLTSTSFSNGEDIPNVIAVGEWASTEAAGYCNFDNDSAKGDVYGRLYNYYAAVDGRNICPEGWHVPNDDEWTELVQFLGGPDVAGGKLKQTGTDLWSSPNGDATNETGFTAIPGGSRTAIEGLYVGLGINGGMWSTTAQSAEKAYVWNVTSTDGAMNHFDQRKNTGWAVRCVKD